LKSGYNAHHRAAKSTHLGSKKQKKSLMLPIHSR